MEEKKYATEKLTREDDERWRHDGNDDSTTTTTTTGGNVDSGFLSSDNLQISQELESSESLPDSSRGKGDEGAREVGASVAREQQQQRVEASVPRPPPSSTEPMRADSGLVVDLGLSESLSQLTLKQIALNPLAAGGNVVRAEPIVELSPVIANPTSSDRDVRNDESRRQQQQRCGSYYVYDAATFNEEPWQLYYAQDDDGDT